jgi:hypothetical protein
MCATKLPWFLRSAGHVLFVVRCNYLWLSLCIVKLVGFLHIYD